MCLCVCAFALGPFNALADGVCLSSVCVFLRLLCSRSSAQFIDDEADASGSDSDEGAAASESAAKESLGSLADFIAEPTEEELEEMGLAFHSDDDDNPLAVLRNARPFHSYRRMGGAAAAAGSLSVQQRRWEPRPTTPQFGAAASVVGDSASISQLLSEHADVDPSFLAAVAGCSWLSDVSLLHDASKSESLYADLLRGYHYDKVAKRQAKSADVAQAGLQELTACVTYCTHILAQRLGLLWSGCSPTPGVQMAGLLMRPDTESKGVVCVELTMHGKPLELSQALLQLVLGHPSNRRWRDIIFGRKLYKSTELIFLTQMQVRKCAVAVQACSLPLFCFLLIDVLVCAVYFCLFRCLRIALSGPLWLIPIRCSILRLVPCSILQTMMRGRMDSVRSDSLCHFPLLLYYRARWVFWPSRATHCMPVSSSSLSSGGCFFRWACAMNGSNCFSFSVNRRLEKRRCFVCCLKGAWRREMCATFRPIRSIHSVHSSPLPVRGSGQMGIR